MDEDAKECCDPTEPEYRFDFMDALGNLYLIVLGLLSVLLMAAIVAAVAGGAVTVWKDVKCGNLSYMDDCRLFGDNK